MTTGDPKLMRETFLRIEALGDGPFVLAADVANGAKDKRVRHSSYLDGAPAVLPAGSTWVLSRYSESAEYWSKSLDLRIRFDIREPAGIGIAWSGYTDDSKSAIVARAFLAALRPTGKTLDTVRAEIEHSSLSLTRGWDLLTKLYEQGKFSLDDVEAAAEAVREDGLKPRSKT